MNFLITFQDAHRWLKTFYIRNTGLPTALAILRDQFVAHNRKVVETEGHASPSVLSYRLVGVQPVNYDLDTKTLADLGVTCF